MPANHANKRGEEEAKGRGKVTKYIDEFYNRQRLHQMLGYKTLEGFEAESAPASVA